MGVILTIIYFLLFCFIILRHPFFKKVKVIPAWLLIVFFALKVSAGMLLIAVYTYYYKEPEYADVYKYFNDARVIFSALSEHPADYFRMATGIGARAPHLDHYYEQMIFWERPWFSPLYNDNRLVIRFNALVLLFSFGNLLVHNVFINFLSFTGLVALFRFLAKYADPEKTFWIVPGLFLFPSLLFWGSGILKEGLLLWAFGCWIFYGDKILTEKQLRIAPFFLFFSLILVLLKPYTIIIWMPCFIAFYLSRQKSQVGSILIYFLVFTVSAILVYLQYSLFNGFDVLQLIASKQHEFIEHSLFHEAGSLIHTNYLSAELKDMIPAFFMGLAGTLFRPHLFEVYSVVTLIAALENVLIAGMIFYGVFRFDKQKFSRYNIKWLGFWYFMLFMGFVGMISPAFGGLVRYKIPALPFLWVFFVHMVRLPDSKWFTDKIHAVNSK